jgi:hypothetical protein
MACVSNPLSSFLDQRYRRLEQNRDNRAPDSALGTSIVILLEWRSRQTRSLKGARRDRQPHFHSPL